jgi:hypothetical protein
MTGATAATTAARFTPSLIVVTGAISIEDKVDIHTTGTIMPAWVEDRGIEGPWILGFWNNLPVLHLSDSVTQSVWSVDLAEWATFTQYDDIECFITEVNENRAREILRKNRLADGDRSDRPITETEVIEMRLKVHLRLVESGEITIKDPDAICHSQT